MTENQLNLNDKDEFPETYEYRAEDEEALSSGALVQEIVRALVDDPAQVAVREQVGARGMLLHVTVAERDIGKVAGKEGKTVDLIQRLIGRVEGRNARRVTIKIVRPNSRRRGEVAG